MRAPVCAAFAAAALSASVALAQEQPDAHELPPQEQKVVKPEGRKIPVAIVGGIRVGGALNPGDYANASVGVNDVLAGVDLGLEVGAIVMDHFYGGLTFGGTLFVSPASTSKSLSSLLIGTEIGYLTSNRGVGGLFAIGVGYRAFFVTDALGNANKFDCPDALFTAGLHIPAGSFVTIMPRIDLGLGAIDGNVHAIFVFGLSAWLGGEIYGPKRRHGHDAR